MLRIAKSLPFFTTQDENSPQSYISPTNGFYISVPTRHGLDNYHGPGMVFQGQLNLQLVKNIPSPCLLRVVFACHSTIPDLTPASPISESSHTSTVCSSNHSLKGQNIFEVEHILVQDQPLQIKRHTFMFNIKFPRVNFPASMTVSVFFSALSFFPFYCILGHAEFTLPHAVSCFFLFLY
jgi:hypothetical protein